MELKSPGNSTSRKIAIVHDALCVSGGAERVALWMSEVFPDAPIFTSVYLPDQTFPEFKQKEIHTLPFSRFVKNEKQFKLLYPLWIMEQFQEKFQDYDTVLTSSTYLAKYIHPAKGVNHKAYIYAPFRFLWKPESYTQDSVPTSSLATNFIKLFLPLLRKWDLQTTSKISSIATSCKNMEAEIERVYHKPATVIYPPVPVDKFPLSNSKGDYFLTVSRLISHKRVDIAIAACNRLKEKLIVVGDGPELEKLKQISGDSIHFAGKVTDEELKQLYVNSKGLIFPSHEDFGIAPIEAQACGVPVIAYGKGGALETIKDGETGLFFSDQTTDSLEKTMTVFSSQDFSPKNIRNWVTKFDVPQFNLALKQFVEL